VDVSRRGLIVGLRLNWIVMVWPDVREKPKPPLLKLMKPQFVPQHVFEPELLVNDPCVRFVDRADTDDSVRDAE